MSIASSLADVAHPGEFIQEELDERGWSQRDLAYILGVPEQSVNVITTGKRGISPDMAKALGQAFNVSAEYFANLQKAYEMSGARAPDPAVARRAQLQGMFPIREMIRRGWFVDTDVPMLEAQLMRFFKVDALKNIPQMAHAAKKAGDYEKTTPLQLAWLYRVKQISNEMVVPRYSEASLRTALSILPRHMVDPEEVRFVPRLLSECGVRFVVVETLPKANIDGVCFWEGATPVIGMSVRHDRNDNFWFVLGHEIQHVLSGDGKGKEVAQVDHDLEGDKAGQSKSLPLEEREANLAGANLCVPSGELDSFYLRKAPYFYERDIVGFARRVQRHPGIVVGQLQHRMQRYDYLTRLKAKVRQHLFPGSVVDGWGEIAPVNL